VAVFPDWETLPYDSFSPHQDLISERLATLWRIHSGTVDVVLLPATTALTAGAALLPGRHHLPVQAGPSWTRRLKAS
jgi:transcription-repair coupling factor (superfamily II helicase)